MVDHYVHYRPPEGLPDETISTEAGFVVSPDDATDFTYAIRGLWVGGAGNVSVEMRDPYSIGTKNLVIQGVQAGTLLPIRIERVNSTATTATLMIGFY